MISKLMTMVKLVSRPSNPFKYFCVFSAFVITDTLPFKLSAHLSSFDTVQKLAVLRGKISLKAVANRDRPA